MYGPVIEGKRLRLRPPKAEDAPVMITWFEDMEVTQYLFVRTPPSLEQEKEWLDARAKDPDSIFWVVEVDGKAVGSTGIQMIDWKNGFGLTGTVIGDKKVWGKGVGGELMKLRADFVFRQTPLRKLKSGYIEGERACAGGVWVRGGRPLAQGPVRGRRVAGPHPHRAAARGVGGEAPRVLRIIHGLP